MVLLEVIIADDNGGLLGYHPNSKSGGNPEQYSSIDKYFHRVLHLEF